MQISFDQIFSLAKQLPAVEKMRLIEALKKGLPASREKKPERELGKFRGKIWMADDFNAPLDDFKDYM